MQETLRYGSTALCAATLCRVWSAGLWHRSPYRAFAAMQAATIVRDLALDLIPVASLRYTIAWEITLPLVFLTQAVAGVACGASIAALYPKIGRFALMIFAGALLLAFGISLAGLPFELGGWISEPVFRSLLICYRWTDTLLAGGLLFAVAFLSRLPRPLRRLPANLVRHTALLTAYFSVYAIAYFFPVSQGQSVDALRMALAGMLYAGWAWSLSASGETTEEWPRLHPDLLQIAEAQYRTGLDRLRQAAGR